jgi:hypothetical protein
MLAAAIGVDRLVEADVLAVIGGDDALGVLLADFGLEDGEFGEALPAIVERLTYLFLKTTRQIGGRAPSAPALAVDRRLVGAFWSWLDEMLRTHALL